MNISVSNLPSAAATAGDGAAIISATGTSASRLTPILSRALNATIPFDQSSESDMTLTATGHSEFGLITLCMESIDKQTGITDTSKRDDMLSLSVSLSGILLLSVRMTDIARSGTGISSIGRIMSAIEQSLAFRVSGTAPILPRRRLFIVAITDFDDDMQVSSEELLSHVESIVTNAYEHIQVPDEFVATTFSDTFDLRVVTIRSQIHKPDEHDSDVKALANVLKDAGRTYTDAGQTCDQIVPLADRIMRAIVNLSDESDGQNYSSNSATRSVPNERELKATFACNTVMQMALDKFRNRTKLWKASVDAGRVIPNFGSENDKLMVKTLEIYDKEAGLHKSTTSFTRKRDELQNALMSDSYALFVKQTLKERESAYSIFRSKLARIRINDHVEKNVRIAVREAEMHFVKKCELLRSKLGNWRFDYERNELVNTMRDDATERLQIARLQGNYVPNIRTPVAFAFHTLLTAPFGRDSSIGQPAADEMKAPYDPDKMKQPGMMRTRPYQRGPSYKFKSKRDEYSQEEFDMLSEFFEPKNKGAEQQ